MNVVNVHNGMNVNKNAFIIAAVTLAALLPLHAAKADGTAAAMYGVKEVLLQYPRIENQAAASFCGLAQTDLITGMVKTLKANSVPVFPPLEAMPPKSDVARIELWPEIYTLNNEGIDCTSWVSLTARSENALRIPPVNLPRGVTVQYWSKGLIVTSSEGQHMRAVSTALIGLSETFANRYGADQPASLPTPIDNH